VGIKQRLLAVGATAFIATAGAFVGLREGEVRSVYLDAGGVPTYCFGGLNPQKAQYTAQECAVQLRDDMVRHWQGIESAVPENAPGSVKASMLSLAYNVGVAGFLHWKNPVLLPLSEGRWEAACAAIVADWKTSKGVARGYRATVNLVPHRGLENRRWAEYQLCVEDLR
jgi:GH24 family phage-related lysozyme (muramidase)